MRIGTRTISLGLIGVSVALAGGAQAPTNFRPALIWEKAIAPGLTYRMEFDPNLPRTLHALRISLGSPSVRFATELAGRTINEPGSVKGRRTPTEIGRDAGALAVINGDFFSYLQGAPIGEMVRAGELITTPIKTRAVFAWGPKEATIGMANVQAFVALTTGEEHRLDAVNQPLGASGLALYTAAEGDLQPPKGNVVALLKAPDGSFSPNGTFSLTVETLSTELSKLTVTPGHAALVGVGERAGALAALRSGDVVRVRTATSGIDWERFDNLIGGGPFLLQNGKVAVDAEAEGFNPDFRGRHPRTAIGKTGDGDVWLVTIDGRQACSIGATLEDLARVMRRLGCTDAINLDGGGSTAMNLLGLTVSRPSDGVERPVSSAIVVFGPRPTDVNGAMKIRLVPKAGGEIQAVVTRNGATIPNADVIWSARGAGWIDEGGCIHVIHAGHVSIAARALGQAVETDANLPGRVMDPAKLSPADR